MHCKEISIYEFPEKELCGLSPNFYIHVTVCDLYIFLQQDMQNDLGNM